MNKRTSTRTTNKRAELLVENRRLSETIEELRRELYRRVNRIKYLEKQQVDEFEIYLVCNSYESGFGHGLANDGFDLSKTPHSEKHLGCAYQIGYEAGQKRYEENQNE